MFSAILVTSAAQTCRLFLLALSSACRLRLCKASGVEMFSRTHFGPHSRKGWPKIIWPAALLMLTALLLLMPTEFNRAHAVAISSAETPSQAAIKPSKSQLQIPVTLYVMSQCPGEKGGWTPSHCGRKCHWPAAVHTTSRTSAAGN